MLLTKLFKVVSKYQLTRDFTVFDLVRLEQKKHGHCKKVSPRFLFASIPKKKQVGNVLFKKNKGKDVFLQYCQIMST